ncbi:MAG: DEAD/DEAH box helicase [Clostridia bacterium]|nr:DEAD/DEAH box helicase [Clostridia bacterium]
MEPLVFEQLELSTEIKKGISGMGFSEATPIQSESLLPIMQGRDLVAQAPTGTGKTCAFGIPICEKIDSEEETVQCLVLCPTRELAVQTAEELAKVSKYKKGIRISTLYGGQPIERQLSDLKKRPQIVVATPGRLMDHLRRRSVRLQNLLYLVLDEADEMLNMGFRDDIETILETAPKDRQTVLFSATMPAEIKEISKRYQKKDRISVRVSHEALTVSNVSQYYLEVKGPKKLDALTRMIDMYGYRLCLVFCNTKKKTSEVTEELSGRGYPAEMLHGDMKQPERDRVMSRFKSGKTGILVATDIAARGIDVEHVEAVFNFDVPQFEEYYVHRIGRTGRANRHGVSYTFVAGKEMFKLKEIMKYTNSKIEAMKTPSEADVREIRIRKMVSKVSEIVREQNLDSYHSMVQKWMNDHDLTAMELSTGLLWMLTEEKKVEKKQKEQKEISKKTGAEQGMARLFIGLGSLDKIRPRHIVELVSSNTGVSGADVGKVDIFDKYSFFEVPAQMADGVLEALTDLSYRGRKIFVEKAQATQKQPKKKPQKEKTAVHKKGFRK